MTETEIRKRKLMAIVMIYPFGVLLVSVVLNLLVFGVKPLVVALPSAEYVVALVIAAALLVINHTWLMTTTELTRGRFNMHATPEEWAASGDNRQDVPEDGVRELERQHNTHRNSTENAIYFFFLSLIFVLTSPATVAVQVWIIGFAGARLGYTYSYLSGRDGARGLFMSLSLLAMYGMTSYLVMSVVA